MTGSYRHWYFYPILSGLLLALSFPPLPTGFIAWIALTPLFISLRECSLKEAFRRGLLFGLVFQLGTMYFLCLNSGAPLLVTSGSFLATALISMFYGPLFTIPGALILKKFGNKGFFAFPFFWSAVEYLRSLGEIGAPWNITVLSQSQYLLPLQIISVTGVWGISFWAAGINAFAAYSLIESRRWLIPAAIWAAFPFVVGAAALSHPLKPASTLQAVIIQGNVDPASKWAEGLEYNLDLYRDLSLQAGGSDLIIWPEAAVPVNLNLNYKAKSYLRVLSDELQVPIFTGALAMEYPLNDRTRHFNSAYLIQPGSVKFPRYDKIHLVPGGERIPFQKLIPALGSLNFGQAEFTPGEEYTIFNIDSVFFGAMICYEAIFPELGRNIVNNGAGFLVNITNDGWFGKSVEPYQQALLARCRSIENRRSLARAANTGISYFTDGYGRFLEKSTLETEAVLKTDLPIYDTMTFYRRYGDIFAMTMLACSAILVLIALIVKRIGG